LAVDDMGWLLASMYQCAYQNKGMLLEKFGGKYEARECRQMLHVMSNNTVDALLKAGVPANTRVAHKHGWINDTHSNAAVFFTPGGDYVMVMILHQPTWLDFTESLPVMAESSRLVYNYFNPTAPQETIRDGFIPEAGTCNFANTPLITDLRQPIWDN
jgi:beta-lactamase class A